MISFFRFQVVILLMASSNCLAQELPVKANELVFIVVENQPKFPGDKNALTNYLRKNVQYPEAAKQAGVTGRVFISFIVERDGRLTDVHLLKGLGFGCDEEAMRVMNAMPRWEPGTQSGRTARVRYNLPIWFGPERALLPTVR